MEIRKCFVPESLEEALEIRALYNAEPLAGGSDMMVQCRQGYSVSPVFNRPVVIISNIEELKGIRMLEDESVEIGALSTSHDIAGSPIVHPLIREAASRMGAIALRNSATIGGNIGNASPKGDLPQPLILLDAEVVLISKHGKRRMLVDDFIKGAKKTAIEPDEIISSVIVPKSDFSLTFYRKIGTRRANAITKLSLSAAAKIDNGIITDFRASSGAAGPKVMRGHDAERLLIGHSCSEIDGLREEFLDAWNNVISPHAMADWRRGSTRRMLSYFLDEIRDYKEQ